MEKSKLKDLNIKVYETEEYNYIRLRDIKDKNILDRFNEWLRGQTKPIIKGLPIKDQDAVYLSDWNRWKKSYIYKTGIDVWD